MIDNGTTVYSLFAATAAWQPDALALKESDVALSYGALLDRVDRLAAGLRQALGPDTSTQCQPTVAVLAENSAGYLVLALACSRAGVRLACLNWRLAGPELAHCLSLAHPALLLYSDRFADAAKALTVDQTDVVSTSLGSLFNCTTDIPPDAHDPANDPEAGLLVLYTSGTTGLPKGAVISNRALIARMCGFHMDLGIEKGDAFIAWAPMFHMGGSEHSLSSLMRGSPVLVCDGFEPAIIAGYLAEYPIGWMILMPAAMEPLIDEIRRSGITVKSVRVVGSMPDLLPETLIRDTMAVFGAPFLNSFGSTETGLPPASAGMLRPGDAPLNYAKRKSGLCEAKLVDASGATVPHGEVGEMAVRGPTLFSGYLDDSGAVRSPLENGWFRMGDLFRCDDTMGLHFCGRSKYLIKSGGENIYPAEIERVLLADERIAEAIAVRQADERWGEVPVVFIALHEDSATDPTAVGGVTEDHLIALCQRTIARYKAPKAVYVLDLNEFPRSETGKVLREQLESWLSCPQTAPTLRRAGDNHSSCQPAGGAI